MDDPASDSKPIVVVRIPVVFPGPTAWVPVSVTMATADGGARDEPSVDPSTRVLVDAGSAPRYPWNLDFEEFASLQ